MDGMMNIWELEDYAQKHGGYDKGRFICVNEKGLFEFQWIDAYFGFLKMLQPKEIDGFISRDQLVELFGRGQEYMPTIGYEEEKAC